MNENEGRWPALEQQYAAKFGDLNQRDASGKYVYHYSLTQRVFMVYNCMKQPLDRKDVMALLNIGDEGLNHAIRRLTDAGKLCAVPGRWGFYQIVPGATMPEDTRGKNPNSHGNRGKAVMV